MIFRKVSDRDQFKSMQPAESVKVRHAGHRAIFVEDLADNAEGWEPSEASKIHRHFGMASPLKDTLR